MRDPSIVEGPDGSFHLVWTTGWWDKGIGIAHSRDLVSWSAQRWLPVMEHEPLARNCWAPEIFHDAPSGRYLIFWATAIPGRFPESEATGDKSSVYGGHLNHRIYFVSTRDFESYSEPRLFYEGGFDVIDATLVRDAGRYALVVKDETRFPEPRKHLRVAFAESAEGPFRDVSGPISPDWVEGPSVLKVGDAWLLYYDEYTRHRYGAARSSDLRQWSPISSGLEFPAGARHGTAFTVPRDVLLRLKALPPERASSRVGARLKTPNEEVEGPV
jgi:beta-xylosidase